jgi:hypothetical protein
MIKEDRVLMAVRVERTLPEDVKRLGISDDRISDYRTLLRPLQIEYGMAVSEDRHTIELTTSARGLITHGSEKGYLYMERASDNDHLLPELDTLSKSGVGSGLRRIEGNWYLFVDGY